MSLQPALIEACQRLGVIPRDVPADGRWHSADIAGDRSGRGDGRIKLHADGGGGLVANWKAGVDNVLSFHFNESHPANDVERKERQHKRLELAEQARAEQAKAYEDAAQRANEIYRQYKPCDTHAYLTWKGVSSVQGLRVLEGADPWGRVGCLVIPAHDATGKLCTLQFIDAAGEKRFLKDGKKAGAYFAIGARPIDGEPLAICEGLATGLSVHAAMGWPIAVAFDAGNLGSIASAMRTKHPGAKLVIAADNDASGTGQGQAIEAARASGAWVALPPSEPGKSTDWNDLDAAKGLDVVRELLKSALDLPTPENSWGNWGTGANAESTCNHNEKAAPASPEDLPQQTPQLGQMPGFRLIKATKGHKNGVYFMGEDPDKPPIWICGPLEIEADTRDATGNNWGRLLSFPDRDGKVHSWAMPMSLLKSDGVELRGELLSQGLELANNATARKLLMDYVTQTRAPIKAFSVKRTGWHGRAFALTDRTIGEQDGEKVFFQAQSLEGLGLTHAGTLEGWRQEVCQPCAGNSRLVLAISAAFAALTLGLVGSESGGLHFRGPSSCGKTTALRVAASIFSGPDYLRTFRSTDNALEGACAAHSDLCLMLDELGQLDPKHAGQVAYLLANGQAKGRASRDGSARAIATWRLLFLSTGEIGLADLVNEAGGESKAGHEVRVLDIQADAGATLGIFERVPGRMKPAEFSDVLKRASEAHYGHAMPAFVAHLAQNFDSLAVKLRTRQDAFVDSVAKNASGQVRRVAARFGLIAAAGEFATFWGLTGWAKDEALNACKKCFQEWLAARGTAGDREPAAMLARVRAFLEQHGDSRFTDWDDPDRLTINRVGFKKQGDGGTDYFVLSESFKREFAKGIDLRQLTKLLLNVGALMPDSEGNATRKERLPGLGNQRVYRITHRIWEAAV